MTVVFTDLVGSTALRARVGEESADVLRRAHDESLGAVATAQHGHVVKGGGDGLLCTFESASDALAAAVGMQQAAHQLGVEHGQPIAIRIGLSIGDVSWDDGDCFGMPVVEAARLEAAAEPGQILCSEFVKVMARGRGDHELTPVGTLDLKGVPEPIAAYAVQWTPAAPSAGSLTPFVGRTSELSALRAAWAAAESGQGGAVVVTADAGVGKSRLVAEFVDSLGSETLVLTGRCHQGEQTPYGPVGSAIVQWARTQPAAAQVALGRQASIVATLTPMLRDALPEIPEPPPVAPEVEAHRLHDAVTQVLSRVAAVQPVVLVVDDLHWADAGTLSLLRALGRVAPGARILVVLAYREQDLTENDAVARFVPDFIRDTSATPVTLGGLSTSEIGNLLSRLADGRPVPSELVELLSRESDGNPLFVRETLLHLVDTGQIRQENGDWVGNPTEDLEIPSVLGEVIGRRIERLHTDEQRLLTVGALFDTSFPLGAAADVAELDEEVALDAIDAALAAQIIEPAENFDTYRFTTAMYRTVLAGALSPSRRVRTHRRIAESLEKLLRGPASLDQATAIAAHYRASKELPGAERGVPYALRQAEAAMGAAAHEDALMAYRAARSMLADGDDEQLEVQRRLARAAVLAQRHPDELRGEVEVLGRLVADCESRAAAAVAILELADLCHAADVEVAWRLGDIARHYHDGAHDKEWVLLRSWDLAERDYQDPEFPGTPLDTPERRELDATTRELGRAPSFIGEFVARDRQDARELASRADPLNRGIILGFGGAGDYTEARDVVRTEHADALDRGDVGTALFAAAIAGRLHFALGEFDGADEMERSGEDLVPRLGRLSNPVFQFWGFQQIRRGSLQAEYDQPNIDESAAIVRAGSPDIQWVLATLRAGLAIDTARAGDRDGVQSAVGEVLPVVEHAAGGSPNYPMTVHMLVSALEELGEAFHVEPLERALRDKIIAPDLRYLEADARLALAMLLSLTDRYGEARGWFDLARAELDNAGNVVLRAEVPFREARAELRRGEACDDAHFTALLAEAREHASALGFDAWLPRYDELELEHARR